MDVVNEEFESELFQHLKNTHLLFSLKILKGSIFPANSFEDYEDQAEKTALVWGVIADFFDNQTSTEVPEKIFKYMYPLTINIIFHKSWGKIKNFYKDHIYISLEKCLFYFIKNGSDTHKVVKHLINLVSNPWDDQSLIKIINNLEISKEETHELFYKENLFLLVTRIRFLIESRCEESALLLTNQVIKYFEISLKNWIVLYIRVFNIIINETEKFKLKKDEKNFKIHELKLSQCFLLLADSLQDFPEITRECVLTAFSLNPTEKCYEKLKNFNKNSTFPSKVSSSKSQRKVKDLGAIPPVTGGDMVRSLNYNPFTASSYILDSAELLKLPNDITSDLISTISYPRYKLLSWINDWPKLSSDCEKYMMHGTEMRCPVKDLLFLSLDYDRLY
ncbi:uncharacterized protein LOC142326556 [Lycorma delicatula]|uniref:uncharacterized protein LOC142326556 n=1 Tax=Lycorma delicatula TaxID=130591 RepID=UPI003F518B01